MDGEVEVEAMVEQLSACDGPSRAATGDSAPSPDSGRVGTHKPRRTPTRSMNTQACSLVAVTLAGWTFAVWAATIRLTSSLVKYCLNTFVTLNGAGATPSPVAELMPCLLCFRFAAG